MSADNGAIGAMHVPIKLAGGIGLRLHGVTQRLKAPGFLPAVEAARHRPPGAIALRQVVPGSAGAEIPQHPVEEAAVVDGWSSRLWLLRGQQRLELLPWCVGQVSSVHSTQEDLECA
jgi:hypothetical protein